MKQALVLQELARERRTIQAAVRALVGDYHLAEDVLQGVFVVALAQAEQFREGSNFRAWVREIARRVAWAQLRKAGRAAAPIDVEVLDSLAQAVELPPDAWESERAALKSCVDGLPPDNRELLRLRYAEEAPLTRIASQLRTTTDGIKGLLKRLRVRLALCVEGKLRGGTA
jgi:RNA polymerase sigma-70 factor (ECF subfamily)